MMDACVVGMQLLVPSPALEDDTEVLLLGGFGRESTDLAASAEVFLLHQCHIGPFLHHHHSYHLCLIYWGCFYKHVE